MPGPASPSLDAALFGVVCFVGVVAALAAWGEEPAAPACAGSVVVGVAGEVGS